MGLTQFASGILNFPGTGPLVSGGAATVLVVQTEEGTPGTSMSGMLSGQLGSPEYAP